MYPPGRYGRRREPRRRRGLPTAVAVAGALIGLLLTFVLYTRYHEPYQPQVVRFELGERSATVEFQVNNPDRLLRCHLRARSRAGAVVGNADVDVPAGHSTRVTHTFTTSDRPVSAEATVCRPAN
jgi:Domain of unknown function (DUF4307)